MYDFAQVFSGAAVVTQAAEALGMVVCPPIDISISPEFDVEKAFVLNWLSFMVSENRLGSLIVEPPCTTFSIMRRPALRSSLKPFGHDPHQRQTHNGNLLAQRAIQLLYLCRVNDAAGLLETPFSRVSFCRTDSCMLGSIHQKAFRFVSVNASLSRLRVRCDKSHKHVQICGSYTKSSAMYTPELGRLLAVTYHVRRRKAFLESFDDIPVNEG